MTIRTRLSLWYAAVLTGSLLVIGLGTYRELAERHEHLRADQLSGIAFDETGEMLFQEGLPAVLLGVIGAWWLARRALAPVAQLTEAAKQINERNLGERIPRTGNGDELDRLAEVFNDMTARLNDSFKRIREFTLHASHELKTPLAVLRGQLETSLREDNLAPTAREWCASQLEELRRLTRIVDNLTLLAKADAGQMPLTFAPLRLDELVRDIFADTEILAEPSGIRVELSGCDPALLNADPHRLRQLLLNLADNAIKYNRPGGSVSMALRRAGERAQFTISNTGEGIPSELLPKVFDRFFRCDPAHCPSTDGSGLGLSIAQWIVSAHKGTIGIESALQGPTTVTVRLPLAMG